MDTESSGPSQQSNGIPVVVLHGYHVDDIVATWFLGYDQPLIVLRH
jgi:hypothetical protein